MVGHGWIWYTSNCWKVVLLHFMSFLTYFILLKQLFSCFVSQRLCTWIVLVISTLEAMYILHIIVICGISYWNDVFKTEKNVNPNLLSAWFVHSRVSVLLVFCLFVLSFYFIDRKIRLKCNLHFSPGFRPSSSC